MVLFKSQNNLILDRVGGYKTLAYRAGYYPGEIIHIQGETIQQAEEKDREGGYPGWRERPGWTRRRIDKRAGGRLVYVHQGQEIHGLISKDDISNRWFGFPSE